MAKKSIINSLKELEGQLSRLNIKPLILSNMEDNGAYTVILTAKEDYIGKFEMDYEFSLIYNLEFRGSLTNMEQLVKILKEFTKWNTIVVNI